MRISKNSTRALKHRNFRILFSTTVKIFLTSYPRKKSSEFLLIIKEKVFFEINSHMPDAHLCAKNSSDLHVLEITKIECPYLVMIPNLLSNKSSYRLNIGLKPSYLTTNPRLSIIWYSILIFYRYVS